MLRYRHAYVVRMKTAKKRAGECKAPAWLDRPEASISATKVTATRPYACEQIYRVCADDDDDDGYSDCVAIQIVFECHNT